MENKNQLYAGIIWIASAFALAVYGTMIFLDSKVPGMGEIVSFLSKIDEKYIYLAAFLSIFIEGLYFAGNFFPGTSLVMIITIISGSNEYHIFFTTLLLIFVGWSLAGIVNIYLAKIYRNKIIKLQHSEDYHVKDHIWTTWFPAFRSSHEVAQVLEGGHPMKVFISSLKVRFWATLFVGCVSLIIPLIININNTSDRESLITIFIVFCISLSVGIKKVMRYISSRKIGSI